MTPAEGREAIAAAVRPVLPEPWTVYLLPPEVPSLPAAVIVPRSPYRRPGTFCAEILGVELRLLEDRAAGPDGLEALDVLAGTVRDAVTGLTGLTYESTDLGNLSVWAGVETIDARLLLELYL
jgi:hypothetical protein